ncbi:hypothetical protein F4560_001170 [Saccharothrix ecbatanensis]|uniref:DUF1416 domain-containing protein n=1 Tax=Saccharothrix ecbatanensis TaxID=1105145 RepID=A0A7W9LZ67_9PSEU|nr:DUF1416 domain-containing protein [Saccharothrix ecbatanensis]MBB5801402.1 hypothetical protein [Saccharothrix ecbatanensis]
MSLDGCGAPPQGAHVEVGSNAVVVSGKVLTEGAPVGGAFVRLLDASGEFTAEVVSSAEGDFRFFAAPGKWTVRALYRNVSGQSDVVALGPGVHDVEVSLN